MNEIEIKIDFTKGTLATKGIALITGDYASTKLKFTFDREDGTKIFEMKNPSDELVYVGEIINGEVLLTSKVDVTTIHNNKTYTKYTKDDAIYWYQPTDNKLFTDEWVEVSTFNLEEYTKVQVNASLFSESGKYIFEVSLYKDDTKLTSTKGILPVKQEQVIVDDEIVEAYIPIFDQLMQDITDTVAGLEQDVDNKLDQVDSKLDDVDDKLADVDTKMDEVDDTLEVVDGKIETIEGQIETATTLINQANNLDLDVSKTGKTATVTITKKDNTTKSENILDGKNMEFVWDGTRLGTRLEGESEYTYVDLQGIQGPVGPQGEPFKIKKTYSSVAEMNADFNNMQVGDYVMIANSVETEDNAKLYTKTTTQWVFITDFSGATGIQGPTGATPNIQIGTVTSGATPSVTRTGTDENPILNFVLQKGDKGDTGDTGATGDTGNGISNIEKTSETATEKDYRINFTDGTHFDYSVENGEVTQAQLDEVIAENDYLNSIIDQLPRVSSTGETITLNNTIEAKMKSKLSPSELSQETTTGKNLFNINATPSRVGANTTYSVSGNELHITGQWFIGYQFDVQQHSNYSIRANRNIISGINAGNIAIYDSNVSTQISSSTKDNFTFSTENYTTISVVLYAGSGSNGEVKFTDIQLEKSNVITDYEPYTGGIASPNPQYPQDIHTTTGDNTIKVEGKNLLPFTNQDFTLKDVRYYVQNGNLYLDGTSIGETSSNDATFKNNCSFYLDAGTYMFSNLSSLTISMFVKKYSDNTQLANVSSNQITSTFTLTEKTRVFFSFYVYQKTFDNLLINCQLEKGSTATPYEPYSLDTYPLTLGTLEYSKIGNYEDEFIIPSGSNLFNTQKEIQVTSGTTYQNIDDNNVKVIGDGSQGYQNVRYQIENLEKNTNYIFKATFTNTNSSVTSLWFQIYGLETSELLYNTVYVNNSVVSFDTGNNTTIAVRIYANSSSALSNTATWTNIQLVKGSYTSATILPYEPYNNGKWYLKKNIGKVVLDGSEDEVWNLFFATNGVFINNTLITSLNNSGTINCICDYYSNSYSRAYIRSNLETIDNVCATNGTELIIANKSIASVADFKTWLSNNNTIVDYIRANPEYILLNDTLQTQLTNIYNNMMSKKGQTNISQVNDGLPMVITASALLDLNSLVS